ncbi:hypothetical protein GL4_3234 [Methyloceanibacter caenitepidi]|uniref:Uncharacterized protein n=1 Tax=Methyloceanibacter caenitepidi TaxID=1384459 RepID=A0A0A8K6W7_9HYPH|nr:hypothetical protein GL4_3234 [Methyloceanibacter caenitepidi]
MRYTPATLRLVSDWTYGIWLDPLVFRNALTAKNQGDLDLPKDRQSARGPAAARTIKN